MIMCKFHARQSKTEGMAASVRVFLEHPLYICVNRWLKGNGLTIQVQLTLTNFETFQNMSNKVTVQTAMLV